MSGNYGVGKVRNKVGEMRNTYKNLSSGVRLSLSLSTAKGRMPLMVFLVCLVGSLPVCPLTRSMDSMTALAESIRLGAIKAEVNGAIITDDEVKRQAAVPLREAVDRYKGRELNERATQILSDILDELIDRQLLVQEAGKIIKDNPIVKEALEKEAESFLKDAMDKVGGPARFYELATKEGINPAEKKKELKEDLMAEALLKEFAYKKISISPKEVRDYYLKHKDEFNEEKEVKVRQILIKVIPNAREAERKAQEVYQRARAGEDFVELAKQFSQDTKDSTGKLYEHKEIMQWIKGLREVVLTLEQGEISQPVRSPIGFHIFKAEAVKPARTPNFEELQDEINNKLYQDEARRRKMEYIKNLKRKAVIKVMR